MRKSILKILLPLSLQLFIAFNFQNNPPSNWYQQFLPNINGRQIADVTFLDSLTGYIVTTRLASPDTSYIIKTTNGGDNWFINYVGTGMIFKRVIFLNQNIGFVGGSHLIKTTNGGVNWFNINTSKTSSENMYVLNQDTIWITDSESLTGGVFRTTNGGVNWTQQLSLGSLNPTQVYFYNKDTGYVSKNGAGAYVRKTTNGGVNWAVVVSNEGFTDMHFINSLTGYRSYGIMKKTTDGGLSWVNQPLPQQIGGSSNISNFCIINKDTIWGVGGYVIYPNSQIRGTLYTTTNGGNNWYYGVPDTSMYEPAYSHVQFINKNTGWAYTFNRGIHTKVGGDPLTNINQANLQLPSQYYLGQNYPNPFNPTTHIHYEIKSASFISIKVFDLQGKELATLVNQKQNVGSYSVSFDALKYNISSGIYFYSMYAEGNIINTRKMMLVK
ncbi:MAG: T9SS type A sorting domain-containing protein [Ignavibacteria bacterium]|nr:T9SS type A sorting domain-containing protein [Ignavibacteria bacterium]